MDTYWGLCFFFSEEMVTRLGKARRGCQGVAGKCVFVGCDVFVFFFLVKGISIWVWRFVLLLIFLLMGMCDGRGYYQYLTKEWKEIDLVGD
jgi:hypothetical protein